MWERPDDERSKDRGVDRIIMMWIQIRDALGCINSRIEISVDAF